MAAQQNVGLNFNKLVADGVKADVLQTLMPPRIQPADTDSNETNTIGELIPLNQVITRGEDVTGKQAPQSRTLYLYSTFDSFDLL